MALNSEVKPQKLAAVAAEMVEQTLTIPQLFQRQGFDQFKGAENDTVYIRVPGILPAHDIADFRAERTSSITFDAYSERKISLTLSGNTYQATKLQDEQKDWDFMQWSRTVAIQAGGVARRLNAKALTELKTAPYLATVAGAKSGRSLRSSLIELRRIANAFRMPMEGRTLVMGTAVEAAILGDDKMVLAQNVGESIAEGALREAFVGRIFGMNLITAQELPADKAYLIVPSAFILATAAPAVPQSIKFGATATAGANGVGGTALRWVMDYDPTVLAERSVVNTYNGVRHVTDVFEGVDGSGNPNGAIVDGSGTVGEFFIRGVAFDVDATADVLPDATANGNASGTGGTAAVGSLLDQFVHATGVGTPHA